MTARSPRAARTALAALLLVAGCSDSGGGSTNGTVPVAPEVDQWLRGNAEQLTGLDEAIRQIVTAVESNDMSRFSDSPGRCAGFAAGLAPTAGALPADQQSAFRDVAEACASIVEPARTLDSAGVMSGLEPLFLSVARLAPILDIGRELG